MLCYVMLCYVMLCYVMLCYVMLCYVMLCYVMVWNGMVWYGKNIKKDCTIYLLFESKIFICRVFAGNFRTVKRPKIEF